MKRGRQSEEEEEEKKAEVDWPSLFHKECILAVLHPYLSTTALIRLACVNKRMNTTWINNERRLSVLDMRHRIWKLTGRSYDVKNPVASIRKAATKSAKEPAPGAKKFYCWMCRRPRTVKKVTLNRERWPYATCLKCAKKSMRKHYVPEWRVVNYICEEALQQGIEYTVQFYNWINILQTGELERMVTAQKFNVWFTSPDDDDTEKYIHKSFLQPFIEQAVQLFSVKEK